MFRNPRVVERCVTCASNERNIHLTVGHLDLNLAWGGETQYLEVRCRWVVWGRILGGEASQTVPQSIWFHSSKYLPPPLKVPTFVGPPSGVKLSEKMTL